MRFKILFLLFFIVSHGMYAQDHEKKKRLNPFLVFDNYFSFIGNKSADVWGFRAGIEWNETWRFGAGYNKLRADIIEKKVLKGDELQYANNDTVKAQLFLTYYPLMAEYIFYNKNPWIISVPVQTGYGKSYFEYFDKENEGRKIFQRGVIVTQAGVSVQYKIVKWIGIGAGLGYRFMLLNNPEIETQMNSPVFAIGIKIYLSEVIKTLQGREE